MSLYAGVVLQLLACAIEGISYGNIGVFVIGNIIILIDDYFVSGNRYSDIDDISKPFVMVMVWCLDDYCAAKCRFEEMMR